MITGRLANLGKLSPTLCSVPNVHYIQPASPPSLPVTWHPHHTLDSSVNRVWAGKTLIVVSIGKFNWTPRKNLLSFTP